MAGGRKSFSYERILDERPLAYKLRIIMHVPNDDDYHLDVWVPKSACEIYPESQTVMMDAWIARERNLIL